MLFRTKGFENIRNLSIIKSTEKFYNPVFKLFHIFNQIGDWLVKQTTQVEELGMFCHIKQNKNGASEKENHVKLGSRSFSLDGNVSLPLYGSADCQQV